MRAEPRPLGHTSLISAPGLLPIPEIGEFVEKTGKKSFISGAGPVQEVMRVGHRTLTIIIERDEDGYYVASVAELPGCHTQARSLDELMERIKEAIDLYLEVAEEEVIPKEELVGVQFITVMK